MNRKFIIGIVVFFVIVSSYFWSGNKNAGVLDIITESTTVYSDKVEITTTDMLSSMTSEIATKIHNTTIETESTTIEKDIESTTIELLEKPTINEVVANKKSKCSMDIVCGTILSNKQKLTKGKEDLIPDDGSIYSGNDLEFKEGESVYDVLLRVTKDNGIHFEFSTTPAYNSVYVEGINNIYEMDCGELSGWMYRVNGVYPSYSSSKYELKNGDKIEWVYTCDLGRDIGGDDIGGQR